jgi:hypothetical protein
LLSALSSGKGLGVCSPVVAEGVVGVEDSADFEAACLFYRVSKRRDKSRIQQK